MLINLSDLFLRIQDLASANIFMQLGLILLVVLFVSFLMRIFKQPLIIGYIFAGILVGPIFFNLMGTGGTIEVFSELGIAFLLFIVGLKLSPKIIKEVGKVAVVTGIGQIVFTSVIGFLIARVLGFDWITALYLSIALTFSSTIIMMKLLSDKDALEKLYGKVSRGFLLVQDFVAIFILIAVSSMSGETGAFSTFADTIFKGFLIMIVVVPLSIYGLPKFGNFFAKSQEFLFLFAIAWGLGLAALFNYIGFSIGVGALIAGVTLSMSDYSFEISSKMKPLRDFFIISFFLTLGAQMVFENINSLVVPAIIFSLFILIGNPLIVIILMGILGYSKRTGFMSGLTVAQISEFSFILIALGVSVGHLTKEILSFVTIIGLFTIAGSTYMVMNSEKIYPYFSKVLSIFEKKKVKERELPKEEFDYILLGYNRIGFSIIKSFSKITKKFLVVDYNPKVVKLLKKKGINAIYGDVDDSEFLEELEIYKAKMIVSTIPDRETNLLILELLKVHKSNATTLLTGRQIEDAFDLYKSKADYVIMPHFLGGEYASKLIENYKANKKSYEKEKQKELKLLKERLKEGQEHPKIEKEK